MHKSFSVCQDMFLETVARRRSAVLLSGFGLVTYASMFPTPSSSAPCISFFVQSLSTFENVRECHFVQHSHLRTKDFSRHLHKFPMLVG